MKKAEENGQPETKMNIKQHKPKAHENIVTRIIILII
jgi:hypothetical protein